MKRFVLFAGDNYYPRGGLDDMRNSFDSFEEAKSCWVNNREEKYQCDRWDWGHVFDRETGVTIDLTR